MIEHVKFAIWIIIGIIVMIPFAILVVLAFMLVLIADLLRTFALHVKSELYGSKKHNIRQI